MRERGSGGREGWKEGGREGGREGDIDICVCVRTNYYFLLHFLLFLVFECGDEMLVSIRILVNAKLLLALLLALPLPTSVRTVFLFSNVAMKC